jgi:putative sterol carrier protein/multimeric flavodoxin WrbA
MRINIYYGGRGFIDDPSLYVIHKMQSVLEELNVQVQIYMLQEQKNVLTSLPQTLKECDGVILATTVEWFGIGGHLLQFLDACWLYGDKEKISKLYMCPIVMSTTYGERKYKTELETAWETLGGPLASGLCGYVPDAVALEMNDSYTRLIEKTAENLYRSISQKHISFPTSNVTINQKVSLTPNVNLTPQETEQLSQYVSDDNYVQKTKEDIKELASLFRNMMGDEEKAARSDHYPTLFKEHFTPMPGFRAIYRFQIEGMDMPLALVIDQGSLNCDYADLERAEVDCTLEEEVLGAITKGQQTFQQAFMSGKIKMKGDFQLLRDLDKLFPFR